MRLENLVKVEDYTRFEGPGLMLQEDSSSIAIYYCTLWGF